MVGWVCAAWAALMLLSMFAQLANGRLSLGQGSAAYNVGQFIGLIVLIGVPTVVAVLLLRPKRR